MDYSRPFINSNGTAALISIRAEHLSDTGSLIDSIDSIAQRHLNRTYHLNGVDVIVKHLNEQSEHDFMVFSGTSYLTIILPGHASTLRENPQEIKN